MRYSIYPISEKDIQSLPGKNITYTVTLNAAFADLDEDTAAQLILKGFVVKTVTHGSIRTQQIIQPEPVSPSATVYTASDLILLVNGDKIRSMTSPPALGENLTVAMLDTGIRKTHKDVAKVILEKDFTNSGTTNDQFNHGTGVASLISYVVPKVGIINLKIMDANGSGSEESVAMAIDYILQMKLRGDPNTPVAVNISAGTPDSGDRNDIIRVACRQLLAQGIYVGAAAGNSGPASSTIYSPACEQYVACIGSIRESDFLVSDFSSRGPTLEGLTKPDLVWFGENIEMASNISDSAVVVKSGTSFSAPFLVGLLVLTSENILRHASYPAGVPKGLDPSITELVSPQQLLDYWAPRVTVKAKQSFTSTKDNIVGLGIPFGDLVAQGISMVATGMGSISGIINGMMTMMMVTMMMKTMLPKTISTKTISTKTTSRTVKIRTAVKVR